MKFEVSISGYGETGSKPVTLRCFYDKEEDYLLIAQEAPFAEHRTDGYALVTNLNLQTRDFLFANEHLRDAIRDYFSRNSQGTTEIDDSLNRFRPESKIENDGIDERGPKYRLAPDIGNGQVAVLAALAFVAAQGPATDAMAAMEDFTKLYTAYEI